MNNDTTPIPESELVARASKGDSQAFGLLYEKYVEKIYNYLYYKTSSQSKAEDFTAQVFLRALDHIEDYEDRGHPFSAWLYRIAHNMVVNWYRDKDKVEEISLEVEGPLPSAQDPVENNLQKVEEKHDLQRVLQRLPEDRQQVLILKFVEGLTNREIGVIMDRTEGAIKALYHRTLVSLRDEYNLLE